jgi:hypothetical protein
MHQPPNEPFLQFRHRQGELLLNVLSGAYNQHSHVCSIMVANHERLPEKLELGYVFEAKALKILRGSYRA